MDVVLDSHDFENFVIFWVLGGKYIFNDKVNALKNTLRNMLLVNVVDDKKIIAVVSLISSVSPNII